MQSMAPPIKGNDRIILRVIGVFLILLGIGAIGLLQFSIVTNEEILDAIVIQRAEEVNLDIEEDLLEAEAEAAGEDAAVADTSNPQSDSVLLAFLDNFGIALPVITLALGLAITYLGVLLLQRGISAARWTQVALIWLCVGTALLIIVSFVNGGEVQVSERETEWQIGEAIASALPFAILLVPLYLSLRWINLKLQNREIFIGEENISSAESRVAWNLLIPTLFILVLVAIRPLEETFITSLTDKTFASGASEINFIGFDNYERLFNITPEVVDCRIDDETGECRERPDGSFAWQYEENGETENIRPETRVITLPFDETQGLALIAEENRFVEAIENTLRFTFISVFLELVLGMIIALIVNAEFAGRGLMRAVMLVPWAIPTVVSARLWDTMLRDNSSGVFNAFLTEFGIIASPISWLTDPTYQLPALIAVDVWKTTPFMALLLLAGLQLLPKDIYEAADVDGASKVRQFFSITLPLLRPTIAVALVFRTLDALRIFDLFNVLVTDTNSLATFNHEVLIFGQREAGFAAAIGVVIFLMILVFTVFYVRLFGVQTE